MPYVPVNPPPDTTDRTPPSAPGTPVVSNINANGSATVTVSASTDNVAVAGYAAFVDGSPAEWARSETNVIQLAGLPSGQHSVAVRAFDAAGNISDPSAETGFEIPVVIQYPVAQFDSVNESRLSEVYKRIYNASQNGGTVNWIVTGDSTRATPATDGNPIALEYYKYLFAKLGVTIDRNAASGMSANAWRTDNVLYTGNTFTNCLALISGTGANSIVEYSLGINATGPSFDFATDLAEIEAGIDALIAAKPDIAGVFVVPVKTGDIDRNQGLIRIYHQLANKYGFPLVDGYAATDAVHGNIDFYSQQYPPVLNPTHPNEFGLKRLINYIVNAATPPVLRSLVTFDKGPSASVTPVISQGVYWSTVDGTSKTDANWTRMGELAVPHGATMIYVQHGGNRDDIICMDESNSFIERLFRDDVNTIVKRAVLRYNTKFVHINIDASGSYNPDADDIKVFFSYMSVEEINRGLAFQPAYPL